MLFYLLIPIITIALYFVSEAICSVLKLQKSKKYVFLCMSGLLLGGIMGLRGQEVGTDTINYINAYYQIQYAPFFGWNQTHYEPLYFLLNKIVGIFSKEHQTFIIIESFITIVLIYRFILRNSDNVCMSVILYELTYLYLSGYNISRFWLGLSIALIGYEYLKQRRILLALFFPIMGALIHTSVIILMAVFFLFSLMRKASDSTVVLVAIAVPVIAVFSNELFVLFATVFPRYQEYFTLNHRVSSGVLFPMIIYIISISGVLLIKDSYSTEEAIEARFQGILLLLGALLLLMGGSVAEAARAAQMFTIFLTLFIPRVVSLSKYGNIFGGLCLLVLIMYYYTQLAANSAEVIPYTTFFS